jgi:biopolymer transport protein ExbD
LAAKLATISTGGAKKRGRAEPNSEPNVVPFIDVMLVLLIIFMVAAPVPTVDIKVDLPPPNSVFLPKNDAKPVNVALYDSGGGAFKIYVDGYETGLGELGPKTLDLVRIANPNSSNPYEERVLLRSDLTIRYRDVVDVMDRLQNEGFTKVTLLSQAAS